LSSPMAAGRGADGKTLFAGNGRATESARLRGQTPRPHRAGQRHRHRPQNRRALRSRRPARRRLGHRLLARIEETSAGNFRWLPWKPCFAKAAGAARPQARLDAMQRILSTYLFVSKKLTPELLAEIHNAGFQAIELFA